MLCVNVKCDYDGFNCNVIIPIVIACMGNLFHKLICFEFSRIMLLEFADELHILIIFLVDSLVTEYRVARDKGMFLLISLYICFT